MDCDQIMAKRVKMLTCGYYYVLPIVLSLKSYYISFLTFHSYLSFTIFGFTLQEYRERHILQDIFLGGQSTRPALPLHRLGTLLFRGRRTLIFRFNPNKFFLVKKLCAVRKFRAGQYKTKNFCCLLLLLRYPPTSLGWCWLSAWRVQGY